MTRPGASKCGQTRPEKRGIILILHLKRVSCPDVGNRGNPMAISQTDGRKDASGALRLPQTNRRLPDVRSWDGGGGQLGASWWDVGWTWRQPACPSKHVVRRMDPSMSVRQASWHTRTLASKGALQTHRLASVLAVGRFGEGGAGAAEAAPAKHAQPTSQKARVT